MDWSDVYFGRVPVKDMRKYTPEEAWQVVRLDMKGKSLEYRHEALTKWLEKNDYSYASKIQSTNYVTALSRGGMIKPYQYREVD